MIYDCNKEEASPGRRSNCPTCGGELIAKCGQCVSWHWAHKVSECDSWAEPETEWHVSWKKRFPPSSREVTVGEHRADVKLTNARRSVIEFQHSPISPEDIQKREQHYGNMAWVIDGSSFFERFVFANKGDYWSFRWKHPRHSWFFAKKEIWIDFGTIDYKSVPQTIFYGWKHFDARCFLRDYYYTTGFDPEMFLVKKLHAKLPCGGWGHWVSRKQFMDMHLPRMLFLPGDNRPAGEAFVQYMESH